MIVLLELIMSSHQTGMYQPFSTNVAFSINTAFEMTPATMLNRACVFMTKPVTIYHCFQTNRCRQSAMPRSASQHPGHYSAVHGSRKIRVARHDRASSVQRNVSFWSFIAGVHAQTFMRRCYQVRMENTARLIKQSAVLTIRM